MCHKHRFACKNCELSICENNTFPPSYVFAGENVYISLTYDGERVLEYCFDRDVDLARDGGVKKARAVALSVLEGQKQGCTTYYLYCNPKEILCEHLDRVRVVFENKKIIKNRLAK